MLGWRPNRGLPVDLLVIIIYGKHDWIKPCLSLTIADRASLSLTIADRACLSLTIADRACLSLTIADRASLSLTIADRASLSLTIADRASLSSSRLDRTTQSPTQEWIEVLCYWHKNGYLNGHHTPQFLPHFSGGYLHTFLWVTSPLFCGLPPHFSVGFRPYKKFHIFIDFTSISRLKRLRLSGYGPRRIPAKLAPTARHEWIRPSRTSSAYIRPSLSSTMTG